MAEKRNQGTDDLDFVCGPVSEKSTLYMALVGGCSTAPEEQILKTFPTHTSMTQWLDDVIRERAKSCLSNRAFVKAIFEAPKCHQK